MLRLAGLLAALLVVLVLAPTASYAASDGEGSAKLHAAVKKLP